MKRFWDKVDKGGPDECWLWMAGTNGNGYGTFWPREGRTYAHRFAYELLVGPIPEGLEIDHLCRNRGCVNPAHLEAVTHTENVRRGPGNGLKHQSHCLRGHPLDGANVYYTATGFRRCRECQRVRAREHYARARDGNVRGYQRRDRLQIQEVASA